MLGVGLGLDDIAVLGAPAAIAYAFTGGALPAGAAITRASHKTRCNVAGAIAEENNDVACFEYNPTSHVALGLSIHAVATNAVIDSRDWTAASWSPSGVNVTATGLTEDNGTSTHPVKLTTANRVFTIGVPVTLSAIAAERAGSAKRYFGLTFQPAGFAAQPSATFDLATGTVTQVANGTAGCVAAPGGWLCWLTATPTSTVSNGQERYWISNASGSSSPTYTGDGASGLTVTEMQLETGSAPTPRIRTSGAAASRAADAVALAGPSGTWRFTFDDASTQDVALVAAGGVVTIPTTLTRPIVARAAPL